MPAKKFHLLIYMVFLYCSPFAQVPNTRNNNILRNNQVLRQDQILRPGQVALDFNRGMAKYDPNAPVKYIFYDRAVFTEINNETAPRPGEYVSLYTNIGGVEYTIMPANGLNVRASANGIQNVKLAQVNARGGNGLPSSPAVFKVFTNGNNISLSYCGAEAVINPELDATGGYLGFQSGQVKISGGANGINGSWRFQPVTEGNARFVQLQNAADNSYLGYTYSSIPNISGGTLPGNFSVASLPNDRCRSCSIRWYYKIYKGERNVGRQLASTPIIAGTYMINTSFDTKSLYALGNGVGFGQNIVSSNVNNSVELLTQWEIEPTTRGTYFIFDKTHHNALGIVNKSFRLVPFANNNFYNTDNLQWIIGGPSDGLYFLEPLMDHLNPHGSGVLTCNDHSFISLSSLTNSYWQRFVITPPDGKLWGFIDMHTHPMSNYGFGGEFFYGAVDGNPAVALGNCNCIHNYVSAGSPGSCSEQNFIRNQLIDALDDHTKGPGYPDFVNWPTQSTTTHQQMWYQWVDRARRSGLRMIIALAQNSHALADAMETRGPYDDLRNMNMEIDSLITFVRRHPRLMDTVTTPARMRSVVQSGRLAVIIGIEMDNIGNFYSPSERRPGEVYNPHPTPAQVKAEIDRLYNKGVRYIFPIHIVNNIFGSASVYGKDMEPLVFNLSNYYLTGRRFDVESVSTAATGIGFKEPDFSKPSSLSDVKSKLDLLHNLAFAPLKPDVLDMARYSYPEPPEGYGVRNKYGLTPMGEMAVKYMMSKGILIDVDHMSEYAVNRTLAIAQGFDYPVNSGHNGPRVGPDASEKTRTDAQYNILKQLGGMIGIGTGNTEASEFVRTFHHVYNIMGGKNVSIGTDVNVGAKLPKKPSSAAQLQENIPGLPVCHTGNRTWNYQTYNTEGVDHYGLMPEFIHSLNRVGFTPQERNEFYSSAEYFAEMWEKCERNKKNIP